MTSYAWLLKYKFYVHGGIKMNKYAYIRVSSKDQNVERQIVAMKKLGLTTEQMYIDKQSGKNFDRKNYQKMI
ncbi:TPA: recombinase family protein, partial [Clostridium perfringens]|nr:recombinase family protein [Clostridium perfringens]